MQRIADRPMLIASLALLSACSFGGSNGVKEAAIDVSSASLPTRVSTSEPQPVDLETDIVNITARSQLTLGMVMEIHVTSDGPELMRIGMMQVRRSPRGADSAFARTAGGRQEPTENGDGDWVIVEAYGKGALVSRTAVSDPVLTVVEGAGLVRRKERTIYASLPTPRRVDTIELTTTFGGQKKRIDVSKVMDHFCATTPTDRVCRGS